MQVESCSGPGECATVADEQRGPDHLDFKLAAAVGTIVLLDPAAAELDRITADLGSASAKIDDRLAENAPILFDFVSDDIFYRNKGLLYGYYILLRELGRDYEALIVERRLDTAWRQMLHSFEEAATLQPIVVVNGAPSSQMSASSGESTTGIR